MNARSWTSWCSAAMLAASAVAGDAPSSPKDQKSTPPAINYSFAESDLPTPKLLNTVKPRALRDDVDKGKTPGAPKSSMTAEKSAPTAEKSKLQPMPKNALPPLPVPSAVMKAARSMVVEPAAMQANVAPQGTQIAPVGAYLPAVDDQMKCLECLKTLSGSPIEADRKAALADLGKLTAWKQMKTAYMVLRRIALTEYNTKMRADAVRMLGESMMEHALAADTLKLSAQYDSDRAIRTAALAQLERLASLPPDRVAR